jgi:alpha-tubulin suppressor-like RCC1 family protein
VACGANFSAALVSTSLGGKGGQVWMWGHGAHGALGNGGQGDQPQPMLVRALEKENIVCLACGYHHCVGVSKKGELWCWGLDASGQISMRDMGR